MDLVYGSLSSSYMAFCVFFSDECFYLYDYGFVCLLICYHSSCCSPRRHSLFQEVKYKTVVRHTICMSFCGFDCDIHAVAWSAWRDRRRRLVCIRSFAYHFTPRLRSLLLILLLLPPPCPLCNPLRVVLDPCCIIECYCSYLSWMCSLQASCPYGFIMSSFPDPGFQSHPARDDVHDPHPGSTAGHNYQLQALGGPDRTPVVPSSAPPSVS